MPSWQSINYFKKETAMTNEPKNLREQLLEAQTITPSLRAAYDKELDTILHEAPSRKNRFMAIVLLLIMLAVVVGEVRVLIVHKGDFSFYVGAGTMLIVCAVASVWLVRDLRKAKVAKKSAHQVSEMLYGAAGILTVASLIHGLGASGNPSSTFGALFVFVFLFVCAVWSLANRISASEMAIKEQMLRLEFRLADVAERLSTMAAQGERAGSGRHSPL
jgi:hypothetical protein